MVWYNPDREHRAYGGVFVSLHADGITIDAMVTVLS
jgi:hypothetical protein